jgi:integrase
MKRNKGLGFVYQPSYRDRKTGEKRISPTWWISLNHRGKQIRKSSNSTKRVEAVRMLRIELAELVAGRPIGLNIDRTTFEDLATILVDDYKANDRRSTRLLRGKLGNLRTFFGMDRATDITTDRITAYVAWRRDAKAANATINRELAALKRAFRLAHRAGRVATVPHISLLHEANARKGFFEENQFRAVLGLLPDTLKPVVQVAYITGWRIASEIMTRKRHHLDLNAGWLRLEPNETKNGEGRMFPLTPELRVTLDEHLAQTRAFEKATGQIVPWLFHREGKPIRSFRRSWLTACRVAGVPGRLRHDFRRTAVRNLERAGVSRSAAMAMVGHRTQSIYQRYAIADETALKEAAVKLAALHAKDRLSADVQRENSNFYQSTIKVEPSPLVSMRDK